MTCMIYADSVRVSPSSLNIKVGEWYYGAYAQVCPTYATCKSVKWSSSNPAVASVNASSGYIYGNSAGTAIIYATAQDGSGKAGCCSVTVSQTIPVSSITLSRTTLALAKDDCYVLTATVCPTNASNQKVVWESSDPVVAAVSDGVVSARSRGVTTITAYAADGSCAAACCSVTVTGDTLVSSVTVSPATLYMTEGDSAFLYETVCPENAANKCVTWTSGDTCVATVNPTSGLVRAQGQGITSIYATAQDGSGKSGSCIVSVERYVPVSSITVCPAELTMNIGCSMCLTADVEPLNASNKNILWCSSDERVAYVSATGSVVARKAGTARIYATSEDNSCVQAYCDILVRQTKTEASEPEPDNVVPESTVADPVDAYTGAHLLKHTILSLYGGQKLALTAHYDSTRLGEGTLGTGWYHNYEKRVFVCGYKGFVYSSPSTYLKYESTDGAVFCCTTPGKTGHVLTVDCTEEYPYCVNCNMERYEYYDANGRLVKVIDHQGLETRISHSNTTITITDTVTGKSLYLEKNTEGRIVKVSDDCGRHALLTYTGSCLTGICDANGKSLTYAYDEEGRVLYGTDAENIRYFENTYDSCGRVASQKDGVGSDPTLFAYSSCGLRTITDRNGNVSTRIFDSNGLLVSCTDEEGHTKTYAYDEDFNLTEETDALCHSVKKVYNSFHKPVEITDKNGNKTCYTYDTAGNLTKIRYPEQNCEVPEETFTYNSKNQLIRHTDLRGTVTVYTYDENGLPLTKKVGDRNAICYAYENGLLTSETDARGNTIRYGYNALGLPTSRTDAANHTTAYEYDLCGHLLKITDANGKTTVYTYDGNYQKTSVTDANGNKTEYAYNGNMKNTSVTLPDGNIIRYEYDGEDRLIKETDQTGNVTITQYDKAGKVILKQFPDDSTIRYEYDAAGNLTKETNQRGAITTNTYDAAGNLLYKFEAGGNIIGYQYDSMSRVISRTGAATGSVDYTYSAAGDLLTETNALGGVKTYTYDAHGNRLTSTDALGGTTTCTYDANNNLLTITDALGNTTTNTYDSLNRLTRVKDAKNNVITYGYDALGRRTTVTDAKNNVFTTEYDACGNIVKVLDAKGNTVTETVYNSRNLPVTVTDAAGSRTTYTYHSTGKTATAADALGNTKEFSYNARGWNTQVKDALDNLSSATYDAMGNVTQLSGPLGGSTGYTYDIMGRLISETTASGGTVSYGYTSHHLRERVINAREQARSCSYDSLGRLTVCTGIEGTVSYTYDAGGNVLTVTDPNGTVTRTYDALNRVLSCTDTFGKTITYGYDSVGNLERITYPDNTSVTYEYDANHNLTKVTDWAGRVTTYTYDVNNKVTGITKPDGSTTATVYDDAQRITSTVERTAGGIVISGFTYTYDALGRITEEIHLAQNVKYCYNYDNLSRVIKRTTVDLSDNSEAAEEYTYDAAGNITASVASAEAAANGSTSVYDTNNRLTSCNGQAVAYDADGNMVSAPLNGVSTVFEYDSANRLVRAGDHTYTYNAQDMRIRNLCGEDDTTYTYNTNAKLSQLLVKTTGGTATKYVYGLGLIGEETGNAFTTYHFDYRGSTVALTDISGNITDTFSYDTYGKLTARTGSTGTVFLYNGRDGVITDENGLIYMRARYYSPELKRFVNADIIAGEISNAITLNRYAYANGNPVSNVDPFGLSAERWIQFDDVVDIADLGVDIGIDLAEYSYKNAPRPKNMNIGTYNKQMVVSLKRVGTFSKYADDVFTGLAFAGVAVEVGQNAYENYQNEESTEKILWDATVDTAISTTNTIVTVAAGAKIGALVGTAIPVPVVGTVLGAAIGIGIGIFLDWLSSGFREELKSCVE